ncbi:MAG TPA: twin-arginine translocase TatA/TatE family subunit [Bacteroidales bacterium]|nr:twin-arginine translocase TatA/TatE family subunit [Bacteroidales bacterium]
MINSVLLAFSPGPLEIILILVIVLLLFGGKKIPELMKGMGKGIKNFKEGINSDDEEDSESKESDEKKKEKK